ncbi:MAG TPA: hypothetical protein V6D06_00840 [Trichocoleus sp.]
MAYPTRPSSASRKSTLATFLAGLTLLFLLWFGIYLLMLRLTEGNLDRPYGCSRRDISCLTYHRGAAALRVWLAYVVVAPPLAGLTARHIDHLERHPAKRRRR